MNNNNQVKTEKKKLDPRYTKGGLVAFLVLAAAMLVYFLFAKIDTIKDGISNIIIILQPIIIGFIIAYLVNPTMMFFDKYLSRLFVDKFKLKKSGSRISRGFSIFFALLLFLLIITVLLWMVVPSLIDSVISLANTLPDQIDDVIVWITQFFEQNEQLSGVMTAFLDYEKEWIENDLMNVATSWAGSVASGVVKTAGFLWDLVIGVIVAVYVLISKETFKAQFKKILFAFMPKKTADGTVTVLRKSNEVFSGFINGKLIDSLIIGILCFIGVSILDMPFAVLVSVIVGVTNIIPVFGPYIGGVVCTPLILLVDPLKGLYFVIFVILLQTFDGNILGPKILGDSTGLSPFWVVFSIVLGGGLFGVAGMIIGVPLFAVIYYLVNEAVRYQLKKKQLPIETEDYMVESSSEIMPKEENSDEKERAN